MQTIIFALLLLTCTVVGAQVEYGEYDGTPQKKKMDYEPPKAKEEIVWKLKTKTDSLDYELYYIRYQFGMYREQILKGRRVIVIGSLISVASFALAPKSSNLSIAGVTLGGTVFVIGGLICWTSNQWLKNLSLKPTTYGVSLSLSF